MQRFLTRSSVFAALILFLISVGTAQEHKPESVYTSLRTKDCKEKNKSEPEDGVVYLATCKGVGGYSIVSLATEHSASINLIAPGGSEVDLDLRSQIASAAPSGLGDKAEWRIVRDGKSIVPTAMIVRVNIFSDPENTQNARSYLVVVKVNGLSSCVVRVIEPSKGQNAAARVKADSASSLPCLDRKT